MLRISELISTNGTRHFLRWNGVKFTFNGEDASSDRPSGVRLMITSIKKDKAPVWRRIEATWGEVCPVRVVKEYMTLSQRKWSVDESGSLFQGGGIVEDVNIDDVKRAIQAIAGRARVGALTKNFTAKSLRVGGVPTQRI